MWYALYEYHIKRGLHFVIPFYSVTSNKKPTFSNIFNGVVSNDLIILFVPAKEYGLKPYPPRSGESSTQNCIQLLMRYTLYAYHIKRQNKTNILKGGCFKQPRHGHTLNMVVLFRHILLLFVRICIFLNPCKFLYSLNGLFLPQLIKFIKETR